MNVRAISPSVMRLSSHGACVAVVAGCWSQLVGGKLGGVLRGPARQISGVPGLCRTSTAGVSGRGKVFPRPISFAPLPSMRLTRTSRACRAAIRPELPIRWCDAQEVAQLELLSGPCSRPAVSGQGAAGGRICRVVHHQESRDACHGALQTLGRMAGRDMGSRYTRPANMRPRGGVK